MSRRLAVQSSGSHPGSHPNLPHSPDMARSRPLPGVLSLAVGTAAMGAFCFGYHLGVVNGPLPAIAAELGFQDSTFVQGLVRWTGCRGVRRSRRDGGASWLELGWGHGWVLFPLGLGLPR